MTTHVHPFSSMQICHLLDHWPLHSKGLKSIVTQLSLISSQPLFFLQQESFQSLTFYSLFMGPELTWTQTFHGRGKLKEPFSATVYPIFLWALLPRGQHHEIVAELKKEVDYYFSLQVLVASWISWDNYNKPSCFHHENMVHSLMD